MENGKNKKAPRPEVGINIQTEDDGKTIRYMQAGLMTRKGFTGLVTDFCGGGQYQDFYFMDGKEMPDTDYDMGSIEDTLEETIPGIIDAIYSIRDEYAITDKENWRFHANDRLTAILSIATKGRLFSAGVDIEPVTCGGGMTIFPDSPAYAYFGMGSGS